MKIFKINILIVIIALIFFAGEIQAAPPILSGKAKVSLLTCGQGKALYEAFGHSAIRVYDPSQGLDVVFNYGVFDFKQENFYANFAKGNMLYMLGLSQTDDFLFAYRNYGRSVREQVLNLDSAERVSVFRFLDNNLQAENRNYLYNYFRNNCSTKIPEMLDSALGNRIVWRHSDINGKASYRSLIYDYTVFNAWGRLGIDLGLGAVIDQSIGGKELNFLPIELEKSIVRASIRREMTDFPLVIETKTLYEPAVFFAADPFFTGPVFLFTILLLTICLSWYYSEKSSLPFRIFRTIVLVGTGALGLVELCIWLFTNHIDAAWNFNLLWANPLWLAIGFGSLIWEKRLYSTFRFMRFYFPILLALWFFLPQTLNTDLIPLVIALFVCCCEPKTSLSKTEN